MQLLWLGIVLLMFFNSWCKFVLLQYGILEKWIRFEYMVGTQNKWSTAHVACRSFTYGAAWADRNEPHGSLLLAFSLKALTCWNLILFWIDIL